MSNWSDEVRMSGEPSGGDGSDVIARLRTSGVFDSPRELGVKAQVDHFKVHSLIGQGGMGYVFAGTDARDGTPVAIKVLKEEFHCDRSAIKQFVNEFDLMRRLGHPRILPVLHLAEDRPVPYAVTPLIRNGSLADLIKSNGALNATKVLALGVQIADVMAEAHRKGLFHRDLKPPNVLIDDDGGALVADFGLVKMAFNETIVKSREPCTPAYSPPEVLRGEAGDGRVDVYGFGATLYQMLTGGAPFSGDSAESVCQQVLAGPPRTPREVNPSASPALEAIALGAMGRKLSERYAAMDDVLSDLRRVENHQWPRGPHPGVASVFRNFWQSYRRPIIVVVAICSVLIAVGLWSVLAPSPSLRMERDLTLPGYFSWSGAQVGDFNADGESDIYLVDKSKHEAVVVSLRGELLSSKRLGGANDVDWNLLSAQDVDGDQRDESIVGSAQNDEATVSVFNQHFFAKKRFTFKGSAFVDADGHVQPSGFSHCQLTDLNRDGKRELVIAINSPFHNEGKIAIRGIVCFDFDGDGQVLWSRRIGPTVTSINTLDVDGDGKLDVLVGTSAPGNGVTADDGTDDNHSYVLAFKSDGTEIWRRETGRTFSHAYIFTANGSLYARVEDYGSTRSQATESDSGSLLQLDSSGNVARSFTAQSPILSAITANLDESKDDEIVASDRNGIAYVLNANLNVIRQRKLIETRWDRVELIVFGADDILGNGQPQLIFASTESEVVDQSNPGIRGNGRQVIPRHNNQVILTDSHLNVVGQALVAELWDEFHGFAIRIIRDRHGGPGSLLVLTDRAQVFKWTSK